MKLYNIFIMGKKNRQKKVKLPMLYTEAERNRKVMAIRLEIDRVRMTPSITPEINKGLQDFVKFGTDYCITVPLPQFSREMVVHFVNNKRVESYVNFKFIKVRIPEEGDENPINKLNKIQENLV